MRQGIVVAVTLGLLAGPVAAADAATVTGRTEIVFELDFGRGMHVVDYAAAPGETNQATMTLSADAASVTVADPTATLTAAGTCTQVDDHTVSCPTESKLVVGQVDLGDGDDRFTVVAPGTAPYRVQADGDTGNDTLATGPADDRVAGGDGDDVLDAGAGDDAIEEAGTAGRDEIEGGEGRDRVSYAGRTEPVQLTLSASGEAAGTDALSGVEVVVGGDGADRLTGDGGPNEFQGGPGDDTLIGAGGIDVLAGDAGRDEAECGPRLDTVVAPDLHRAVHSSCETVRISVDADSNTVPEYTYEEPAHPTGLTPRSLILSFACPQRFGYDFVHRQPISLPASCEGRITVRQAAGRPRPLGKASFRRDDDTRVPVLVKLNRRGRGLLARRSGTDIVVATSGETLPPVRWRTRWPR